MHLKELKTCNIYLLLAATTCFLAAVAHLLVILGGPEWYRAFGAGEEMAVMAEQGLWYPTLLTLAISALLMTWGLYALSAAGFVLKLPWPRLALVIITLVFLGRAAMGPLLVVTPVTDPHLMELQQRPMFLVFSSTTCLVIGLLFLLGLYQRWPALVSTRH
ncbi:hypothetical protein [Zobellella sp. DQSA1]|uniref:hypothetical protein n=1 Tax=Zobellella sp. DQSA1 TaxID=3342386 RepID=UPI0035C157A6